MVWTLPLSLVVLKSPNGFEHKHNRTVVRLELFYFVPDSLGCNKCEYVEFLWAWQVAAQYFVSIQRAGCRLRSVAGEQSRV